MGRVKDLWGDELETLWTQLVTGKITRREAHKVLQKGPMEHDDQTDWLDAAEAEAKRMKGTPR